MAAWILGGCSSSGGSKKDSGAIDSIAEVSNDAGLDATAGSGGGSGHGGSDGGTTPMGTGGSPADAGGSGGTLGPDAAGDGRRGTDGATAKVEAGPDRGPGPDAVDASRPADLAHDSGKDVPLPSDIRPDVAVDAPALDGTGATPQGRHNLGTNFFYNDYWDFGYVFADLVKQSKLASGTAGADGWPTGEATYLLLMKDPDTYDASGIYKLYVEGAESMGIEAVNQSPAGSVTITNRRYAGGVITADVTLSSATNELWLHFFNTSSGLKNLRVYRPGHGPDDVFAKEMLAAISLFTTLRPMQMVGEPTSPVVSWSQRRSPRSPSQSNDETVGIGVSYEYLVMLANTAHKDLWLCLPRLANEDFIRNVANLIRYGSDGSTPYTSPQASPAYPPLDPDLHLYLEFSNEIWNYRLNEEWDLAVANVQAGDANHFNWDGTPGLSTDTPCVINLAPDPDPYRHRCPQGYYWANRRTAFKAMRISDIFRSVFGDSEMPHTGNGRIRPVLAGQIDRASTYQTGLEYIEAVYGPGNSFGNPGHPVSHYFWAVSGAPYPTLPWNSGGGGVNLNEVNGLTVADIFAALYDSLSGRGPSGDGDHVFGQIDALRSTADKYGLHMVAYEGGQSVWANDYSREAKAAAQLDPRMQEFTEALLEHWFAKTDDVFLYFTLGRAGDYFSIVDNGYDNLDTPKWRALKRYAGP